jgi:hypothetical protein
MNRKPPAAGRGKKPGTLNGTTKTLREVVTLFVENNAAGAQALYDRVARTNPAKALAIFSHMCEFVLPKLARTEVTLPPESMTMLGGPIVDVASATAAYLAFIGNRNADISKLRFEPAPQPIEADVPTQEATQEPLGIAGPPMYHSEPTPGLESEALPDNVTALSTWERLGR